MPVIQVTSLRVALLIIWCVRESSYETRCVAAGTGSVCPADRCAWQLPWRRGHALSAWQRALPDDVCAPGCRRTSFRDAGRRRFLLPGLEWAGDVGQAGNQSGKKNIGTGTQLAAGGNWGSSGSDAGRVASSACVHRRSFAPSLTLHLSRLIHPSGSPALLLCCRA